MQRGVPFSISIMAMMLCVVGFLSVSLLAVGWRSTSTLEEANVDLRMSALDEAITSWLTGSVRATVFVQQALAKTPAFASATGPAADAQIVEELAALLGRQPVIAAAYAGYADGRFVYVGRAGLLAGSPDAEPAPPSNAVLVVRVIHETGGSRQESWHFLGADGRATSVRNRPSTYDPRTRPWYHEATDTNGPIMTEPYTFALNGASGVSVATPIGTDVGVIGFDFTLENLSRVASEHKLGASSMVMVATAAGNLLADTGSCASCKRPDPAVSAVLRGELVAAAGRTERRIDIIRSAAGKDWEILVDPMPPVFAEKFWVGVAVPVTEVAAESRLLILESAAIALAVVLVAIGVAFMASVLLSRAMGRLAARTELIRNLDFSDPQPVKSRIREILQLSRSIERMRDGLEVFGRYVAKDLVRQIMRSPAAAGVGGQRREVTVMFSDIEGFSRISEDIAPELLTSRLSRYFDALAIPIAAHKGTIDKFIGDSIMAFWNAPELDEHHVEHACRSALLAAAASRGLVAKWHGRGRPVFRTRFGLHAGPAVIGNVGARDRINYTLVGAVANQASRLEGLNKFYRTEILASGAVAARTRSMFVWRQIDSVVPAGTSETVEVFELVAEACDDATTDFLVAWNAARAAYLQCAFAAALSLFEAAARHRPDDGPCGVMIGRCRQLLQAPPPAGWTGIWHFDAK